MKGMREIRNRMKAVASIGQITHAMELVAASKMKRAQNSAEAGRAYAILLMDLTETVLERLGKMISRAANIAGKKRLIIVFSTDKGLCGSLNSNIFKAIAEIPREEADYIAVGSRAGRFIAKTGRVLKGQFKISDAVAFAETRKVAEFAMKLAGDSGEYGSIEVLYPIFVNTLRQETALVKLAPADDLTPFIERLRKSYKMADVAVAAREERNVEFEPSAGEVLARLPQYYIRQSLHHIALDAKASEHSARMVAMKSASDNADALLSELNLEYNKARQSAITTEILELSSAAAETGEQL